MHLYPNLQRNQFLADIIVNENSDMSFASIISGNNIGEVWVDNLSNPTFCLVWSEFLECFQFMGNSYKHINKTELQIFIENKILPFLHDKKIDNFEFACDSEDWFSFTCNAFAKYKIQKSKQYVYKLNCENNINMNLILHEDYDLFEINKNFIKNEMKYENFKMVKDEIEKAWGSMSRFLEYAKCFVAVYNNKICSFAFTEFIYKNIYGINVETFEPHKQKGLSSFLTITLINNSIKQNAFVWWDCMASNIASQKTAQKVGLTFDHEYEVCWFNLK